MRAYAGLGACSRQVGELTTALNYYQQYLSIALKLPDNTAVSKAYCCLGNINQVMCKVISFLCKVISFLRKVISFLRKVITFLRKVVAVEISNNPTLGAGSTARRTGSPQEPPGQGSGAAG